LKRLLQLYLFAALLVPVFSHAQLLTGEGKPDSTLPKMDFGIKIGTNTQNISGSVWDKDFATGICGGFFARMHKNKIGGRIEVLVATTSLSSPIIGDSLHKGEFNATYLNIPLLFEFNIIPHLMLQAGVQYSNLMGMSSKNVQIDIKSFFKQGEFSAVVGLEGKLPKNFLVGARYRYGLTDINSGASPLEGKWTTSAIQAYIGYTIPHKG